MSDDLVHQNDQVETILGHYLYYPIKYFVKMKNKSYRDCVWLNYDELLKCKDGEVSYALYSENESEKKTRSPYFPSIYLQIDRIVAFDQNKQCFIVKWRNLNYDQLTEETNEIPEEEINKFYKREEQIFPSAQQEDILNFRYSVDDFSDYKYNGNNLSLAQREILHFFIQSFLKEDSIIYRQHFNDDPIVSICSFFEILYDKFSICGPHLIITTPNLLEQWEDVLHNISHLTALFFVGEVDSIDNICANYFYRDDGKLNFHILFTTTNILEIEFSRLEQINWVTGFFNFSSAQSNTIPLINKLNIQQRINVETDFGFIKKFQGLFDNVFRSEDKEDNDMGRFICKYIDSPLSKYQKQLIKIKLKDNIDKLYKGDFEYFVSYINNIVAHPFSVYDGESKLSCDFIESSVEFSIIVELLQQYSSEGKTVLISCGHTSLFDIIIDVLSLLKVNFNFPLSSDPGIDNSTHFTHCLLTNTKLPSVNSFDVLIITDNTHGLQEMWAEYLRGNANSLNSNKHIFLFRDYSQRLPNIEGLDPAEQVVRHAAFDSILDDETSFNVKDIIENAKSFSIYMMMEKCHPKTVDYIKDPKVLWDKISSFTYTVLEKELIDVSSGYEWAIRTRNCFIRGLSSVCWGDWSKLRLYWGLNFTDEALAASAYNTFRFIKGNSSDLYMIDFDENADNVVMMNFDTGCLNDEHFQSILKQINSSILQRSTDLYFIKTYVETFMDEHPLPVSHLDKPTEWWDAECDKALLLGLNKYGYYRYDYFLEDPNPSIRKLMRIRELGQRWYLTITDRVYQLVQCIQQLLIFNDPFPTNFQLNMEGTEDWLDVDKKEIIKKLMSIGVHLDEHGEPNYIRFYNNCNLGHKTVEDVKNFSKTLISRLKNGDCFGLSPILGLKLNVYITSFNKLREMLRVKFLTPKFLQKGPKWENMPAAWHGETELFFFRQIESLGYDKLPEICSMKEIARVFPDGVHKNIQHIPYITRRISILYDYIMIHAYELDKPKHSKVIDVNEIEYPILITPSTSILSLGEVVWDRPGFHTERYIYPAGFKSSRLSASLKDPDRRARWISEIADNGNEGPEFRVWQEDVPDTVFCGSTPTAPWSHALKAVASKKGDNARIASISGPEAFQLAAQLTTYLIQQLPNADKCLGYTFKSVHPPSVKLERIEKSDSDDEMSHLYIRNPYEFPD